MKFCTRREEQKKPQKSFQLKVEINRHWNRTESELGGTGIKRGPTWNAYEITENKAAEIEKCAFEFKLKLGLKGSERL